MSMQQKNKTKQGNMKIHIKRRYRYFKVKNIVMILCLIAIATMSGAIGAEFILDRYLGNYHNDSTGNNNSDVVLSKNDYKDTMDKMCKSIVTVSNNVDNFVDNEYNQNNVTGVVVNKNGYILTSASKIKNFSSIYVKIPIKDCVPSEATLVGMDEVSDIAIIKINNENLVSVDIAEKNNVRPGDNVFILGNAVCSNYISMCTEGIITSTNNRTINDGYVYTFLQTDAVINEFNSGGPICNSEGKLVGFASQKLSEDFKTVNLYYGASLVNVRNIIENLVSLESILGITGKEMDSKAAETGLYIESVVPNSYAAKAGIKSSDIIIRIDDHNIKSNDDVYEAVKNKKGGDTATCVILRDKEEVSLTINFDK